MLPRFVKELKNKGKNHTVYALPTLGDEFKLSGTIKSQTHRTVDSSTLRITEAPETEKSHIVISVPWFGKPWVGTLFNKAGGQNSGIYLTPQPAEKVKKILTDAGLRSPD